VGFNETFQSLLGACVVTLQSLHGDDLMFVVHFGSTARGHLKADTDVDLFVCLRRPLPEITQRQQLSTKLESAVEPWVQCLAEQGHSLRISTVYRSLEGIKSFSPLHLDLATDGIVLFDPEEQGKSFIEGVKVRMSERGTVRKRVGMRWYWANV
jgi:predicted nucleotidyltransferase